MSVFKIFSAVIVCLALLISGATGLAVSSVSAQESQAAADNPTSIRLALEQQLGKRAKLKLVSYK